LEISTHVFNGTTLYKKTTKQPKIEFIRIVPTRGAKAKPENQLKKQCRRSKIKGV